MLLHTLTTHESSHIICVIIFEETKVLLKGGVLGNLGYPVFPSHGFGFHKFFSVARIFVIYFLPPAHGAIHIHLFQNSANFHRRIILVNCAILNLFQGLHKIHQHFHIQFIAYNFIENIRVIIVQKWTRGFTQMFVFSPKKKCIVFDLTNVCIFTSKKSELF